ncbi:hypothetical protein [Ralstonia pickettii]|uniref:hypothetical protein n=1 Tax=Ralstonia pickettii TaxID=329 RepID=UPI0015B901E4|nr:hypothetical protein [Ralstonia pickettii]NWK44897.1 hypothetical protein [Ralstonia pickettii]
MAITAKDFAMKGYEYKIDLASERGGIWLDRTVTLKTGETVSFNVQLEGRPEMDLTALHRESIQRVIEILQAVLNPEPEPESTAKSLTSRLA